MRYMRYLIATTLFLLIVAGSHLSSQSGSVGTGASAIRQVLSAGQFAEAERLATESVAASQAASDAAGAARLSDLLVEALTKGGKIGERRTVALAEKLVVDKATLFGPNSVEVAVSLDNLGVLSTERGEFAAAVASHERALAIRRRARQSGDAGVADSLERLAVPLIWLERFAEARRILDEAKHIRERPGK